MRARCAGALAGWILVATACGAAADVVKDDWDWPAAMRQVAGRFRGTPGKVVPIGDSITYANPAGQWARYGKGRTPEELAICKWMRSDVNDKSNGWWLAADDQPSGRSWTAVSGQTAEQCLAGGVRGSASLDAILKDHDPQIAIFLLGTNDAGQSVPAERYLAAMEKIYEKCLARGTIPVVTTVPPRAPDPAGLVGPYNAGLVRLAKQHGLPLVDYHGAILARRPGDAWQGTLISKDGVHPSAAGSQGPATAENLATCGYLLRCWLNVHKVMEIKRQVLDATDAAPRPPAVTSTPAATAAPAAKPAVAAAPAVPMAVAAGGSGPCPNAWVTSDAPVCKGGAAPNAFSLEALHASPGLANLAPAAFCKTFYDCYHDGRRQDWAAFQKGLSLWAHTPQKPMASQKVIELDPILLLNVHGSGYCGIQSGMLEAVYQSRPGGEPGKPAIDARRWFLGGGLVHSVTDAFYDGRWHYYDVDQSGWGGDAEKEVWSVADVLADRKGYYGPKTTLKSQPFYAGDKNGAWVDQVDPKTCYTFQDTVMAGHEMAFALRKGETFTRFFGEKAAGWSEPVPAPTKPMDKSGTPKGFCEIVYAPPGGAADAAALSREGDRIVLAVRCPYNITSSKVEADGPVEVSTDLGRTWAPLDADGAVPQAVNRWDYLLKVGEGKLRKVTTRGVLHPGSLPRVGSGPTTMTVASMGGHQVLTWIPDWSSEAALDAAAKRAKGLKYANKLPESLCGGGVQGSGDLTIPVKAPPGAKLVKVAALVMGSAGTVPEANKFLELSIGPAGATQVVARSTDCSGWGKEPATKVDHWENNVAGSATFAPCDEAEVNVGVRGWGAVRGVRLYAGYVPAVPQPAGGTLVITHGFDGKTVAKEIPLAELAAGPVSYAVADGARENDFIRMELR